MPLADFQKTHTAVAVAQSRVEALELDLVKAKASLAVKFSAHAKHFKRQSHLADEMGICGPYLCDILKGKRGVSKHMVEKLLSVAIASEVTNAAQK